MGLLIFQKRRKVIFEDKQVCRATDDDGITDQK
jgi:hypothetical protein